MNSSKRSPPPRSFRRSPARTPANEWGSPVFDLHFHLRPQPAGNLAHLDGAGVTKANLLTRGAVVDQVKALQAAAPGRFTWFNSYDVTKPDAEQVLTQAVKDGAQGFGEMKFHVAADGPELRRMYALAADLRVPILIHFQEVDHFPERRHLEHGVCEDVRVDPQGVSEDDVHRACGRVLGERQRGLSQRSGLSDRSDQARRGDRQMAGRLSQSLRRHVRQLRQQRHVARSRVHGRFPEASPGQAVFGSDCGCSDGHGGGVSQNNNPAAARMAGKCVARETLSLLKRSASPDVFQKIVWGNVHRLLRIPA